MNRRETDQREVSTMSNADAMIAEAWRLSKAWSKTARDGKKAQERARIWALGLGFAGGLAGALSTLGETEPTGVQYLPTALGLAAALLVATAAYFGRELITQERETAWTRARILAEALKRECWKCLVGLPPYHNDSAGEELEKRVRGYLDNLGLPREPIIDADAFDPAPTYTQIDDYIANRAREQMGYYEKRSGDHQLHLTNLKRASFLTGLAAVVLGVVGTLFEQMLALVPVATSGGAAIVAWLQAARLAPMVDMYQQAASQLRLRIARWEDRAPTLQPVQRAAEEHAFVEACETIMARENDSWQAEWMSEDKVNQAIEQIRAGGQVPDANPPEGS